MCVKKQLTKPELLDMKSVLERALQRAERQKRDEREVEQLAMTIKDLVDELARLPS